MKSVKFLIIAACLFALTACLSGGSAKGPVDSDTRVMTEVAVASDGSISYTGSGNFEGFSFTANVPALAGRTVYIEKSDSSYTVGSYTSVSDLYSVRLTKDEAANVTTFYSVNVTVPYSSSQLANAGGTAGSVKLCSLVDGAPIANTTTVGAGAYVSANATFPMSFFAGFKKTVAVSDGAGIIKLQNVSYAEASDTIADPKGTLHPDTVRGITHVQQGEKVVLGVSETNFGETVASSSWSVTSKPSGSAAALTQDGSDMMLLPDVAGVYKVTLNLTGINGKTASETVSIVSQNYSYNAVTGDATCMSICHDGSASTSEAVDKYGRLFFRDIVSIWGASAHANAFTPVAAETDTSCFQCHTTGFNFADRDNNGTDDHPEADGYDDSITDWNTPSGGDLHLRGVACEACHGPGMGAEGNFFDVHYSKTTLGSGVCLSCHEMGSITGHHFDYKNTHDMSGTLAGGNVAKNEACFKCHTGEGAMGVIFDKDVAPSDTDTVSGIGCPVCHDPHGETANAHQLRTAGSVTVGTASASAGNAKVCYNCHNADTSLPAVGTIPHNSSAEMLNGVGGYTYGTSTGSSAHHVACIDCHMKKQDGTTHNMVMTEDVSERIDYCTASCHSAADLTFGGGHYDMQGKAAAVRTKVDQLQAAINAKAGTASDSAIRASYTTGNDTLDAALNRAAYNYNFILSDKSSGFHNPDYAETLIDLSLADLESN